MQLVSLNKNKHTFALTLCIMEGLSNVTKVKIVVRYISISSIYLLVCKYDTPNAISYMYITCILIS